MNPCIATIFMRNIDPAMLEMQKKVVEKFNKSKIMQYPILTDAPPGYTMDKLVDMLEERKHDAIMFLDVDALPLSDYAIDYFFDMA